MMPGLRGHKNVTVQLRHSQSRTYGAFLLLRS